MKAEFIMLDSIEYKLKYTNPFKPSTPNNLVQLLKYLHDQRGFTILPFPIFSYYKMAKDLIYRFDARSAEIYTLMAGELAQHPWTFKFVNSIADTYKDDLKYMDEESIVEEENE